MCGGVLNGAHRVLAPLKCFGPAHHDIVRDVNVMHRRSDFELLGSLGALHRHDDEQIHIAIRSGFTPGVRAKKDDLVRVELRYDSPDHAPDLPSHWVSQSDHTRQDTGPVEH